MFSAGVPSKLVLLPDLERSQQRAKVRFLGCVEQYDPKSATLSLSYTYQSKRFPSHLTYLAEVDASHVLETLRVMDLQIGSWVNVVGYVTPFSPILPDPQKARSAKRDRKVASVQAILLWDARQVALDKYEEAVLMRKTAQG